jgi:hypothetical protein
MTPTILHCARCASARAVLLAEAERAEGGEQ